MSENYLKITKNNKTTTFFGENTSEIEKLYYSLLRLSESFNFNTNDKITIELYNNNKKSYYFSTFKNIF